MLTEKEVHWYKNVYRGDSVPQLTLRAVIMGSLLGGVMALSNLYIGLKTGWALGVAITACILSFSISKTLHKLLPGLFKTEMGILENNCMQSTASSAGYSTGGAMVAGISAYLIVTGEHVPPLALTLFTFFLAALGVFLAIPMKRQMINVEQLPFPSGIAAAETLTSLHSTGPDAMAKARSLGAAGAIGAFVAWCRDAGKPAFLALEGFKPFPGMMRGIELGKWTLGFEMSTIMVAGGAIMGWRVCWSMMFGALVHYLVLAPWALDQGAIDSSKMGYRAIMQWATWGGAAIMVTSGLLTFAFQWRTIGSAFGGLSKLLGKKAEKTDKMSEAEAIAQKIEVPTHWFLIGAGLSGVGCIILLAVAFGTSIWMGIVAVLLTFFLSLVACRATGETDITPIGAMGKITQLTFGMLAPANLVTNLMTASVTAASASASADLLVDLKSGYILGANPRKQFIAQFMGIFMGTLVVVPAFYLLIPDAASIGTDQWPAPSAQVWAAVAKLLANGVHALHPAAQLSLLVGGIAGIILPLLEKFFPKAKPYIPSATGLGLSMVIPFFNTFSMFLGGIIALVLEKKAPKFAEKYVIAIASGLIAGESLMGVVIAILQVKGIL